MAEFRMLVWLFGTLSSPGVATLALRRCATDHAHLYDKEVSETISHDVYVDDLLKSVDTEERTLLLLEQLPQLLSAGGFRLTKWMTNNATVLAQIPEKEWATGISLVDGKVEGITHALGMKLDVGRDRYLPAFDEEVLNRDVVSRRDCLGVVAAVWLPLGIWLPLILPGKLIVQQLASLRLGWDEEIPSDLKLKFNNWRTDMKGIWELSAPRWIHWKPGWDAQVHIMADASMPAYGAGAWLRTVDDKGEIRVTLLMAKSRVFPLNEKVSGLHGGMPRRELVAAWLGAEMARLMRQTLSEMNPEIFLWTDSFSVQRWVTNPALQLEIFVANRVTKILAQIDLERCKWLPGCQNPGDQLSRGITPKEKEKWYHYLHGPSWLALPQDFWPSSPSQEELEAAVEKQEGTIAIAATAVMADPVNEPYDNDVVGGIALKTNSFDLIVRRVRMVRRFSENVRRNICARRGELDPFPPMGERQRALMSIVKYIQQKYFERELSYLRSTMKGFKRPFPNSKLRALNPFLDKTQTIRVGGRLGKSVEFPHPIILPREKLIVAKILRNVHVSNGHAGPQTVGHLVRKNFWILQGGAAARSVVTNCTQCRRRFRQPEHAFMKDHPGPRLQPAHPFETTGVDLCGPFTLKSPGGRATVSRYVVLFTCLRIRGIHVEVAEKLSTDAFLKALVRFVARRPGLRCLVSDNGTNFVGSRAILQAHLRSFAEQSASTLQSKGLSWIFAPPRAPSWGGAYERAVALFKKALGGVLPGTSLSVDAFHTFCVAAESIVNSRPLLPVPTDCRDVEALSPSSFICPGVVASSPLDVLPPAPERQLPHLSSHWLKVRATVDAFWKRWQREYLSQLQSRKKWACKGRNLRVGDVVLVVDKQTARSVWPLGLVLEVVEGEDGVVRRVFLRTSRSNRLERHVTGVVLLEGAEENFDEKQNNLRFPLRGEDRERNKENVEQEKATVTSHELSANAAPFIPWGAVTVTPVSSASTPASCSSPSSSSPSSLSSSVSKNHSTSPPLPLSKILPRPSSTSFDDRMDHRPDPETRSQPARAVKIVCPGRWEHLLK